MPKTPQPPVRPISADPAGVLSTGAVAYVCGVGQTLASSWCDDGGLPSYRLPSGQRRVVARDLVKFMRAKGLPLDRLPTELAAG